MNFYEVIRPRKISDFVFENHQDMRRLEMLAGGQLTFPSPVKNCILLHGTHGAGKTELAKLLPHLIEKSKTDPSTQLTVGPHVISCQSATSIVSIKKEIPTTVSFDPSGLHYIILDEVDNLKTEVQRNLKGLISESRCVVFILTTNNYKGVDNGIISRSHVFSFNRPCGNLWLQRLIAICNALGFTFSETKLREIIANGNGDARTILANLEEYITLID